MCGTCRWHSRWRVSSSRIPTINNHGHYHDTDTSNTRCTHKETTSRKCTDKEDDGAFRESIRVGIVVVLIIVSVIGIIVIVCIIVVVIVVVV